MQSAENVLKHRNDLDLEFAMGHMTWPSMPSHNSWVASGTRHEHPRCQALFILINHLLMPDALKAFKMNKSNGGVQQGQKDTKKCGGIGAKPESDQHKV